MRKNNNDAVKILLQQFKNDNIELMERIRDEQSAMIYRSDNNTNSTSENISKSKESNDLRQSQGAKNKKVFKPPLKISSTSTTGYTNSEKETFDGNIKSYATVATSNDMLSTVIQSEDVVIINPTRTNFLENHNQVANNGINENLNSTAVFEGQDDYEDHLVDEMNKNASIGNKGDTDVDNMEVDDVIQNSVAEISSEMNTSSDSDIAFAQTQVLETLDMDTENSPTLSDQDLMKETLNEIYEELDKRNDETLENVILTPPLQFR